jgi:hypothetical protein
MTEEQHFFVCLPIAAVILKPPRTPARTDNAAAWFVWIGAIGMGDKTTYSG